MKRILKYGTGDSPPEGAVYLGSIAQTQIQDWNVVISWKPCWLVWHYFLVEVLDDD